MTGQRGSLSPSLRDRYLWFVDRHEVAWELSFAALAVVYVVVGFVEETSATIVLEFALTAVFTLEFVSRIACSHDRRAYFRSHWIDLAALIPTTRALRIARLLRLLRLVRAFAGIYRALGHASALARHRGLMWLFAAWVGVMVICSLALYAAENSLNDAVRSPFDALWWGVVTLTTVGYGDVVPTTPEGRLAAMTLMLLGIGLFSAITATVTSFMLEARPIAPERSAAGRLRDLQRLHAEGLVSSAEFDSKRRSLIDLL
jgi:voltage-gated potassium channel